LYNEHVRLKETYADNDLHSLSSKSTAVKVQHYMKISRV